MSRLSEDFHEALTSEVLTTLFKKSIYTCLAFVRTNPELLAKITKLQYHQILEIKDVILTKFSSQLRYGHKYYQDIINHCAIIPTGIDGLDKLLDSGFMTGNIYELCGISGSGKTQICMTVAVNICTSNDQHQIFYIDTKNDISAHRLADIIETRKKGVGETLQKIQICRIRSAFDLLHELQQMESKLRSSKEKYLGFRVIILDSLSALFQHFQKRSEGLSLLNATADLLRFIATEYHLAVLLTSLASCWTSEEGEGEAEAEAEEQVVKQVQRPGLGKYWAHVPHWRLMVRRPEGSSECFLVLLKSSHCPMGKSSKVKIGDNGVT